MIDEILFGKAYKRVHHEKDVYSKFLGPSHRVIAHDPLSNLLIALAQYPDDPLRAYIAATVHDAVDITDTKMKRALTQYRKSRLSNRRR